MTKFNCVAQNVSKEQLLRTIQSTSHFACKDKPSGDFKEYREKQKTNKPNRKVEMITRVYDTPSKLFGK